MVVVVQRVQAASVTVANRCVGQIGRGYLLLIGVAQTDTPTVVERLVAEVLKVRLHADADGKLGLSIKDIDGEILAVSQFTLLADFTKGNRPSFNQAAKPEQARPLFEQFVAQLTQGLGRAVPTGVFGADMQVTLVNDGPVTVVLY